MKRIAWAGLAAALWCGAQADGKLTAVQSHKVGKGVEIQVQGEDLATPKILRLNGNRSYMLEFNASLLGNGKRLNVNAAGVQYVRTVRFRTKPPITRVHVWLKPGITPTLARNDQGWLVTVGSTRAGVTAVAESYPSRVPALAAGTPIYSARVKAPTAVVGQSEKIVDLNLNNAEIVLILKALADQAGANIITGPEVAGKMNVNLRRVTLREALDYVTTMARLRYAKIGKTYIVTSNARYAEAVRQIAGKLEDSGDTRVVQLISGEGVQIKAAAFKAMPQVTSRGEYDIILPSEDIQVGSTSGVDVSSGTATVSAGGSASGSSGQGTATSGGSGGDTSKATGSSGQAQLGGAASAEAVGAKEMSGTGVKLTAKSSKEDKKVVKDAYVVVVGSAERIAEVVSFIKALDREVAGAANVGPNKDVTTKVVPIYSAQVLKVRDAVQSIVDRDARKAAFQIADSRAASASAESGAPAGMPNVDLLFVTGPQDALETLVQFAKTLDQGICDASGIPYAKNSEEARRLYEVVDLRHIEPLEAANELQTRVLGLQATIMPSPVDPIVLGSTDLKMLGVKQPPKGTRSTNAGAVSGATSTGTGATGSKAGGEGGDAAGGTDAAPVGGASSQTNNTVMAKTLGTEPMRVLLYGTQAQIDEGKKLLGVLDLAPRQVALELRVMELTHEDALKLGLDWSILTGGTLKSIRVNQSIGGSAGTAGNIEGSIRLPQTDTASVLATLDSMTDNNKLISRPNILANDGRPSEMFIGDKITYIESVQSTQTGVTVTTKQLDVGVTMLVTARVGADSLLTMDLRPSLTFLRGWTPVPGGGQIPQTAERRANTITSMKSGETIAIGGLIQDQDKKTVSGIPFLRDLPLLGQLFSRTSKSKVRSEIVFFLTAKVVENDRATAAHPRTHDTDTTAQPGKPK